MVKHIILWKLKDEYSSKEKLVIKQNIKKSLEGLKGEIPGLIDVKVRIDGLSSSTADLMLDTTFEDEAALKAYAVHPKHIAAADSFVRPYTALRSCLDFVD
ncbi:MAG: Dabb family protein [Clostridia bacterium]|nr:Dabb family protein [Clostridia bacterium]